MSFDLIEAMADPVREKALQDYRKKLLEHKEVESRLKESEFDGFQSERVYMQSFHLLL